MVRTRFAPSPTGYMHIGNLRTALYAYLIARHSGGQFILRIEDTDKKRNVLGAVQVIYDSLRMAGIEYDEGPDKDGGLGPYIQSQRKDIYKYYAEYLVEQGTAYRCFCTKEEIKQRLKEQGRYKASYDKCRFLSKSDVKARVRSGESYVVRQRIPETEETAFVDLVYGKITIRNDMLDDQILLRSDGFPTYNFANVVDDHLMEITHVVRGVEYLSSVPKYNLLYSSFGWDIPKYVHLPHITKESGKKLSKREGAASFQDLLAKGYLPEALVNYIALLGWNPGDDREYFTMEDLIREFSIDRINKASAAFSFTKLNWLNGEHIRNLSGERFHAIALGYYSRQLTDALDTSEVSRLIQPRVVRLTDIPQMVCFFVDMPEYSLDLYNRKKSKSTISTSRWALEKVYPVLENLQEWTNEVLYQRMAAFAKEANLKIGTVMWPLRVALSGLQTTPGGATGIAEVIGKDETLKRISAALKYLSISE